MSQETRDGADHGDVLLRVENLVKHFPVKSTKLIRRGERTVRVKLPEAVPSMAEIKASRECA